MSIPFSRQYPKAVAALKRAGVEHIPSVDVCSFYMGVARVLDLPLDPETRGSVRASREALQHFERTGTLPRIQTAIPPAHIQPTPPVKKLCKVLKHYGVSISRKDPEYSRAVVEVCQKEYLARFGEMRERLAPSSARAILAMIKAGARVAAPKVADGRQKVHNAAKRAKKMGATKKPRKLKASSLTSEQIAYIISDAFLDSFEWRKTRYEALKLSSGCCCLCGRGRPHGVVLNVDHIKPRKKYPDLALVLDNLQVLCHDCNHGKGNWDATDWR